MGALVTPLPNVTLPPKRATPVPVPKFTSMLVVLASASPAFTVL